jgi:hypothetical protein
MRRAYSDQEKAGFLLALEANGGNLSATERETGVPISTLASWRDGKGVNTDITDLCNEKAPSLAEKFEALAHKLVDAAPDFIHADKTTLSMVATSAGIATDKAQLLRGKATEIRGNESADALIERVKAAMLTEHPAVDPVEASRIAQEVFERLEAQRAG